MRSKNLIVGIFMVTGLVLFMLGLVLIGNRHEAFARHVDYYAEFTNLAGLTKGSKVQVAGMDAGEVLEIAVPSSPAARFRVKMRIDDRLQGLVRTDSLATIGTQGVVGETFMLLHSGSAQAPAAAPLSLLPSKEPIDISNLLDQGQGLVRDADVAIKDADGVLKNTGSQLGVTLGDANTVLGNVNDVVVGLKQGKGPAGMLLSDQELATHIRQTVANAQEASVNLAHVSSQASGLMTDIQARNLPQKIDDTMTSARSAAANLDAGSQQLRQTIAEASAPDHNGETAGANIRETLSNINYSTANVADDTEALKHNILLRGFFHRRGYFNLDHISSDSYRKDQVFTNPHNTRAWLPADQMFEQEAKGTEQLTAQGKTLLDGVAGAYGDSIVDRPIVIEGYWAGADTSEQLARSRARAIMVRHYLENHFQLAPANVGVVAMKDTPPASLDHATWNGVCVVIVTLKK